MAILLLALLAVAVGLWLDASRRLSAERERHATEIALARAGWRAATADARDAHRLAAAWRAEAVRAGDVYEVAVLPREPSGDHDAAATTEPRLRAVEGPEGEA